MDFNDFHSRLAKGTDFPFFIRFLVLTFSSWLFQGIFYMDTTEKYFKVLLDFIIFFPLFFTLNNYLTILLSFLIAITLSHTINWIFNGQIFVLLKNLRLINTTTSRFFDYLEDFKKRVENENSIVAAAAFGSLSREKIKKTSDLDIRVIRNPGIINGINACVFVLKERTKSFFKGFPLDIYLLDSSEMVDKHIKKEKPIIIYDPNIIFDES